MNAFAGFVSLNQGAVSFEKIESMMAVLVAYVPDQKYLFGNAQARFAQLIRHNTPESFDEPTYQNYVHDIRLDNRQELANQLDIKLSAQMPDSHLVLKAYERWGSACLNYFLGDFAFAIWDPVNRRLFCARDPTGQRLIYYCYQPGHFFAFASVISGLLAIIPREINREKVRDFLNLTSSKPEETFYKKIFRLKAGENLRLEKGQILRQIYKSFEQPKPIRFKKDSDYLEAFLEIFGEAVRCRLRSAFPLGAHSSGGLDSSSVVALSARELSKLTTFSAFPPIGYQGPTRPNWNLDDTHYVEMLAQQYPSLEPIYVRLESRDLFKGLDESYAYLDVPILNPCNRIWIHEIFEQASWRDIRVLLTGAMGNATISWKGISFKQRLGKMLRKPSRWDVPNPRVWMISKGVINESLSFFQGQRAYFGIELRDPTHDQRLVEFCLGLPNSQFARGGSNRMLIRRAMQGLLPDPIRMRTDQGSQLADWPSKIKASYSQICQEWNILKNTQAVRENIDIEQIDNLIASWPQAELESPQAMSLYRHSWLRAFFVARFVHWMEYGTRG